MKSFPDYEYLMKEGESYRVTMWEDQVLDIQIPSKVVYVVTETEDAVRGDTVQGVTKDAVLETGLKIRVPGFIKQHIIQNLHLGDLHQLGRGISVNKSIRIIHSRPSPVALFPPPTPYWTLSWVFTD